MPHRQPCLELANTRSFKINKTRLINNKIHSFKRSNCSYKICKWASRTPLASKSSLRRGIVAEELLAATQISPAQQWQVDSLSPYSQAQTAPLLPRFRAALACCHKLVKSQLARAFSARMIHQHLCKHKELNLLKTLMHLFCRERTLIWKETLKVFQIPII